MCRKEEGYGTAPTFNVSILMGKRDEVIHASCVLSLHPLYMCCVIYDQEMFDFIIFTNDNRDWNRNLTLRSCEIKEMSSLSCALYSKSLSPRLREFVCCSL